MNAALSFHSGKILLGSGCAVHGVEGALTCLWQGVSFGTYLGGNDRRTKDDQFAHLWEYVRGVPERRVYDCSPALRILETKSEGEQ